MPIDIACLGRAFALSVVAVMCVFLLNNYLIFWLGWPGALALLSGEELEQGQALLGWLQVASYAAAFVGVFFYLRLKTARTLLQDSQCLEQFAGYIIRAAFWAVLLIGLVDMAISWLRVENSLLPLVGESLDKDLARAQFRGTYVHYPLILLSCVLAAFTRSLGFTWLTLMVVVAEFLIVLSRFVFSYEKSFMGDLVRFWYASLFLFASAHTLVIEGHVRVDVVYERLSEKARAYTNIFGVLLLGLPLCWTILILGLWGKGSSINSPLLTFEITQSGYGLYVKYLMVSFLLVFAVTMVVQFCAYFLANLQRLLELKAAEPESNSIAAEGES